MNKEQPSSIDSGYLGTTNAEGRETNDIARRRLLFIVATHGNEGFSLEVLKSLEPNFPKETYGYDWVIGNPQALGQNVRYIDRDLNRSAPGDTTSTYIEEKRAAELMTLSQEFNGVIDIHGTESDSGICTIIPYPTMDNIFLSLVVPIKNNVIWYAKSSAEKGPITQYSKQPAIEIECGPKNSPAIAEELKDILSITIQRLQGLKPLDAAKEVRGKDYYAVYGSCQKWLEGMRDFAQIEVDGEKFYPFLVNQYRGQVVCYKMKKINVSDLFLY